MFTRLVGALVRAIMIVVVILTPSLLIPGTSSESAKMIMLVALAFAMVAVFEYGAKFPGLIEFRDAPPFNRLRVIALFLTLFGLSVISRSGHDGSTLTIVVTALGFLVGQALDFPYSPLRLVVDQLPQGIDSQVAGQLQAMAGLSMLVTLLSLFLFSALVRLEHWPNRGSAFNVWINLPTFDPTAGGDVVKRLNRDGRVNVIFGIFAPFVIPAVLVMGANQLQVPIFEAPQTMVWAVTIWMFLPLSLIMRGLAMLRIARMIRLRRARLVAGVDVDGPSSALSSSAA
ncbi:hypothetical protein [Jannaschia sp. CCS1]|uniref:hypothetical protein n=1 Tax=Jannaschia sp. (strain CCS1) TaxID=290400 RepID=UPI000053CFEE|nr:hypothetical protein [Jannaschia sp. CCS1]ABD53041.1 hypothetical protein Jann_0124 [Jannaschia sp. CCS1]